LEFYNFNVKVKFIKKDGQWRSKIDISTKFVQKKVKASRPSLFYAKQYELSCHKSQSLRYVIREVPSNARFQSCVLNIRFHFITPRQVGMLSYNYQFPLFTKYWVVMDHSMTGFLIEDWRKPIWDFRSERFSQI